jgi:hypothetical protein
MKGAQRPHSETSVQLPYSMRESLVDDVDEFLEAFSSDPEPEAIANYVVEGLETFADEEGIDDIIATLEEGGELEASLLETLETEMTSNDEFEYTGEEVVSLLERLCGIEWEGDQEEDEDDEDDDEDDDDEEEEDEEE